LLLLAWGDAGTSSPLSGAFDVSLLYDVSSGSLQPEGEATVELTFATWKASAELGFDEGVWDALTFEVLWSEEAFEIESRLRFEPDKDRFRDWKTSVVWIFGEVSLKLEHDLTRTRDWLALETDWASDAVDMDTRVRFRSGDCEPLAFYDAEAKAAFSVCGTDTSIEVEIDDDGFDALTLTIEKLIIDRLPWLSLDLEVGRTLTGTTIEIDPSIELGEVLCLEFEAEISGAGGLMEGLSLTEAKLEGTIGSTGIEATVYLDPDDWIDDRYAATLILETEGSLAPERAIETETTLFWSGSPAPNLARITPLVRLELSERASAWLELDIDVESPALVNITAGAELTW